MNDLTADFDNLLTTAVVVDCHVLDLLEVLLQFCRTHGPVLSQAMREDLLAPLKCAAKSELLSRLLQPDAKSASALNAFVVADLLRTCRSLVSRYPASTAIKQCLVVWCFAEALDQTHSARIKSAWNDRGRRELTPGRLVPVFSPFEDEGFRKSYGAAGTPPFKLDRSVDRLRHAVLVPAELPHAVRLMVQPNWPGLDLIGASTQVVCGLPSGMDLEVSDLDMQRGRFFGAAPRNAEHLRGIALDIVKRADQPGVGIVVLPELCLDSRGVEEVAAWVRSRAKHIAFAVCGSHHEESGGQRRNEAMLAARLGPTLTQEKVVGMEWKPDGATHELREDIERPGTALWLITGNSWSLAVLICRDCIDSELGALAVSLRVSLVLAPACSPRTTDFLAAAVHLASQAQAHVVLANKCSAGPDEPDFALLARPSSIGNSMTSRLPVRDVASPASARIALSHGDWIIDN